MKLRSYQEEDVAKLLTLNAAGLFNEPRTGKTPTSLVAMQRRGVKRLLIVCPASLLYVWKRECEQWTDYTTTVITDIKKYLKAPLAKTYEGAVIVNYENVRRSSNRKEELITVLLKFPFDGLIVDEAHRCKNRKSNTFYSVSQLSRKIPYRIYCTGTPAQGKPWDIWAILHFIDSIVYRSYWKFINYFFVQQDIFVSGRPIPTITKFQDGKEQVLAKLLDGISCNRKRKDIMQWLPEQSAPTEIALPCTRQQLKYLKELEETFQTGDVITVGVLDRLVRVRQICTDPGILNLKSKSPKTQWLLQYNTDYPEKQIIIFSLSKKYLLRLYEVLSKQTSCGIITGDVSKLQRQEYVDAFQSSQLRVLLLQTQAGKEGLTLDNADVTIFVDTYPPAADYQQARDRMVATTEERVKPKEIIHLMMEGTYDARLYDLVDKNISANAVINDYKKYLKGVVKNEQS